MRGSRLVTTRSGALRGKRAGVDLAAAAHLEGGLAVERAELGPQIGDQALLEGSVGTAAGLLAEEHRAIGAVGVGVGAPAIEVAHRAVDVGGGGAERDDGVVQPGIPAGPKRQPRVDPGQAADPLRGALAVAQVAAILEPLIDLEGVVDRLHAVVGEHDRGHRTAVDALGGRSITRPMAASTAAYTSPMWSAAWAGSWAGWSASRRW